MNVYIVLDGDSYVDCFGSAEECLAFIKDFQQKNYKYVTKEIRFRMNDGFRNPNDGGSSMPFRCRSWEDCSNPYKDCINCPVMGNSEGYFTTTTPFIGSMFREVRVEDKKDKED